MRKRILNRYKKFVRKYSTVDESTWLENGQYYIEFRSNTMTVYTNGTSEYECYKELVKSIKEHFRETEMLIERGVI